MAWDNIRTDQSSLTSQRIIIASTYTPELAESQIAGRKLEMIQKPFEFESLLQLIEGDPGRASAKVVPRTQISRENVPATGHESDPRATQPDTQQFDLCGSFSEKNYS